MCEIERLNWAARTSVLQELYILIARLFFRKQIVRESTEQEKCSQSVRDRLRAFLVGVVIDIVPRGDTNLATLCIVSDLNVLLKGEFCP